jgi:trans-resveratrol di-O-methyltransferase
MNLYGYLIIICMDGSELLLDAQAHIWNHIFNFINSMSLKCAIELGIPDIIHNHGKPMTLSELTAALPIHPTKASSIYRLMRILNHSNFFALRKIGENIELILHLCQHISEHNSALMPT